MAKKEKVVVQQLFADVVEARTAAVSYGQRFTNPKTGKESKWGVFEFPNGKYVVARSFGKAVVALAETDEAYKGKRLKAKAIPAPREYVNYCDMDKLNELLEAITERKDKLTD